MKIESICTFMSDKDFEFDETSLQTIHEEGICVQIFDTRDEGRGNEIVVYTKEHKTLSDNMPILENLGLCIDSEVASKAVFDKETIYLRKYVIACLDEAEWHKSKDNLSEVIAGAIIGKISNSPLNALAYLANISAREIRLIKAIAAYEDQLITVLSEQFIAKTLVKHSHFIPLYRDYFDIKFNPTVKNRDTKLKEIDKTISEMLHAVENISEDRVVRIFFQILAALTRTNA